MSAKWQKRQEKYDKNLLKMFKVFPKIDWQQLEPSYAQFNRNYAHNEENDRYIYDRTYRVYHHSFKMYNMMDSIFSMWDLLFKVFKFKTAPMNEFNSWETNRLMSLVKEEKKDNKYLYYNKETGAEMSVQEVSELKKDIAQEIYNQKYKQLISNLKKLGATDMLLKQASTLRKCRFSMDKNNSNNWIKDSMNMKAFLEISRELVDSCFYYLYKEYNEQEGIFKKEEDLGALDSKTALVMETLYALSFRYGSSRRNKEDLKALKEKMRLKISKSKEKDVDASFENFYNIIKYEISNLKEKEAIFVMAPKFSTYDIVYKDAWYERAKLRWNNSKDALDNNLLIESYSFVDYTIDSEDRKIAVSMSKLPKRVKRL